VKNVFANFVSKQEFLGKIKITEEERRDLWVGLSHSGSLLQA
jgi:hypothetical protein